MNKSPLSHCFAFVRTSLVVTTLAVALCTAAACSTSPQRAADHPLSRAAGDVLAERLIKSLGGKEALGRLQTISFEWVMHAGGFEVVRHRHDWDIHRGLHRYRSGAVDVTHRLGGKGVAKENGEVVTDKERERQLLADAFRWWTNDTYWLMSPHKVMDANTVRVAVDGDGDGEEDELRISFGDGVGLTPGDAYIYFFDDSGAPTKFQFLLESGPSGEALLVEEVTLHGVSFHLRKIAGPAEVRFEHLEVSDGPRDELFAALATLDAPAASSNAQAASQPATAPPQP